MPEEIINITIEDSNETVNITVDETTEQVNITISDGQVTNTSELINDGEDGVHPFITLEDIPASAVESVTGDLVDNTDPANPIINLPSLDFVPYTGATQDVDLGVFGLLTESVVFSTTPFNVPTSEGSMYYNDTDGTLDLKLKGGNVTLQIGQESVIRVVNKTATNITLLEANYQAVRVTGAQGQRMKVDLAQATTDPLSAETIGLVTETIANNQEGFVTTSGLIRGINTTGTLQGETWADGDILYLSPAVAGRVTKIKPTAPNHLVIIGYVIHAHITQGTIFVKVDNGYELDELHNVKITSAANNNILVYNSTTDIWENKNINQIVSLRRNANNTSNNYINYCGIAPNGSAEATAVWNITRLTIVASGSITTATATNVAWTNRESATYI